MVLTDRVLDRGEGPPLACVATAEARTEFAQPKENQL